MTTLPQIGKLASRALNEINISTLEQVSKLDELNLSKLHGVGPKAINILKDALKDKGMSFSNIDEDLRKLKFTVIGDLKCDNAPKRKIMRDLLIATTVGDESKINELLTDDFIWHVPGEFDLNGKDNFIHEIKKLLQKVSSLEVKTMLSHGKEGSTHGTIINTTGEKVYFADMYTFENHKKDARINTITSYIVIKS